MSFVGCIALAPRCDGGPPLVALNLTPLSEALPDSLEPSLKIGALEAAFEADWLQELCLEITTLAEIHHQLEGAEVLVYGKWEPATARVHYNELTARFVITADLALTKTPGGLDAVIAAFQLPRDTATCLPPPDSR